MLVRRSGFAVLLLAAGWLAAVGSARAQMPPTSPGQHESLTKGFSPEDVKAAVERFTKGGLPPDFLDFLRKKMEQDGKKFDEKELKQLREMLDKNPDLRKQVEEAGKQLRELQGKKGVTPKEREELLEKLFPKNGPMNPGPLGPMNPPLGNPPVPNPNPQPGPIPLPNGDPNAQPIPQPNPLPNGDPNPPLPPAMTGPQTAPFDFNETPRERMTRIFTSAWERNIAPLDDTPEVKRALFELVEGAGDISDLDGKSFFDNLGLDPPDGSSLAELFDGASMGESWNLPKFDLPSFNWGRSESNVEVGGGSSGDSWWKRMWGGSRDRLPSSTPRSSGSGGFSFGTPGVEGSWWSVVIVMGLIFGSLAAWKLWSWRREQAAAALGLGGPGWPIDPRRITTRQHVVLAFEYLSVLICGPTAKTWTHTTIASALAQLAVSHGETAMLLARLYELARYAPLDEPLTTAELAEARRLVCTLAGLEHE